QKIQTSSNVKGFTLVELIVVITILVILGTIAFLNLGGMSATARDSQRTSDLNQINQQIMTLQAKSGMSYVSMVSGTGLSLSGVSIAGTGVAVGSDYAAGDANYTVLGIDKTKMSDPTSAGATKYKMGATTLVGGAYELAATLEETNTALVMGTYRPRTSTSASGTITGTGTNTIILGASDIGKFFSRDTIVAVATSGNYTGTITSLVTGTALTLGTATTQVLATGGFVYLADPESSGLIGALGALDTAVTNKGTALPY
ncbi:hypothetical protein CO024_01620, partial [Candidatus Gracilibacteria bacterium CG_4_9_14_0_2_um_filter_38_7]